MERVADTPQTEIASIFPTSGFYVCRPASAGPRRPLRASRVGGTYSMLLIGHWDETCYGAYQPFDALDDT